MSNRTQWASTIADVDNDGYNDILVGGSYDNLKLARNNGGEQRDNMVFGDFDLSIISNSNFFVQGTNFVDIDSDGYVDIFSCNDDAESYKFRNDGTGRFSNAPDLLNTETSPRSDNSGNYANTWTDFDNDGDLDLYISKCREDVDSPSDPRRINMLFENDGRNNFREIAAGTGLKIGAQTWTSDFADIDNDGDMDVFILNHDDDVQLMRNNGNGTFTDITSASGFLPSLSDSRNITGIQSIFRDFNNDGFVDLLFTGSRHFLFYNNGDNSFSLGANPFGSDMIASAAVGDLNQDGFLDIYASYADLINTPSSTKDEVFFNQGNDNNFVSIQLVGTSSNKNGIGARLELYGDWGRQIREVKAGEGYGIANSFTQHFGIGDQTIATRLVVHWPSGITQEVPNPQPNEFLTITEPSACAGQPCNDGNPCTINDTNNDNCDCVGVFQDDDNDGICNADDVCPGSNDNVDSDNDGIPDGCDDCDVDRIGRPCNDSNACTINDRYTANCDCVGVFQDDDNDGVCNAEDRCPGSDDNQDTDNDGIPNGCDDCNQSLIGQACNDGNPCTENETYDANCNCSGTIIDRDNDGICDANDSCLNFDNNLIGLPCDD